MTEEQNHITGNNFVFHHSIPNDVLRLIFSQLDVAHCLILQQLNKFWYKEVWSIRKSLVFNRLSCYVNPTSLQLILSKTSPHLRTLDLSNCRKIKSHLELISKLTFLQALSLPALPDETQLSHISTFTNLTSLTLRLKVSEVGAKFLTGFTNLLALYTTFTPSVTWMEIIANHYTKLLHFQLMAITLSEESWKIVQGNFTNLTSLQIKNFSPTYFSENCTHLTNLQMLTLISSKARSSKKITDTISKFTKLHTIQMTNCHLKSEHLEIVTNFRHLTFLKITENPKLLSDDAMKYITSLQQIQFLQMDSDFLTDKGIELLSHCTNLRFITLNKIPSVTSFGMQCFEFLTKLERITLHDCHSLTDDTFSYFSSLTRLSVFHVCQCQYVTEWGVRYLSGLTNLYDLTLHGLKEMSDEGLAYLSHLTNLVSLDLINCKKLTQNALKSLTRLTNLEYLSIAGSFEKNTPIDLSPILHFTKLSTLSLFGVKGVTESSLRALTIFQRLESLSVMQVTAMNDELLKHFSVLTNIRSLYISRCQQITDQGIAHLTNFRALHLVELAHLPNITNETLKILGHCKNLRTIQLSFKPPLTVEATSSLRSLEYLEAVTFLYPRGQRPDKERLETILGKPITLKIEAPEGPDFW